MKIPVLLAALVLGPVAALRADETALATPKPEPPRVVGRPLMRDFIGLNVHTVLFKPELYAPVTRVVRSYHPLKWDLGNDTSTLPPFPLAANKVNWASLYGGWVKAGYRVHASLLFDDIAPGAWKALEADAAAYGRAFAEQLGPGGKTPVLEAVEIGNEPSKYSDDEYRRLFLAMAGAIRQADPKLRIATCAANLGPSGRYSKSVDLLKGHDDLWDILNIHCYAEIEGWPTWRRGAPEDPSTHWLEYIGYVSKWRDDNASAKELWVTEFGYDATTKPSPPTGDFSRWVGSTETQQAQWIVRAFLLLPSIGVDRAHLYYFNDDDTPHLHGSSGLTRNFQPKPAFHAVAWLSRSLGDYRFASDVKADGAYAFKFRHGSDAGKRIIAIWRQSGAAPVAIPVTGKVVRAERMPLAAGDAEPVVVKLDAGKLLFDAGEAPIFVWIEE